ncbi:carboxylesterase/lipase family protein [Melittangium boletus]|uniref:carboxylesterase/lipase family protein n=1 Tax=Melittangium boletus TaxID=83453 RepID=UPI003DA6733C
MRLTAPAKWFATLALPLLLTHCAHSGPRPAPGPAPVVPTAAGPVQGIAYEDGSAAFLGIPFAEPPVGARRWRAPAPAAPWTGPRDASHFGPMCPQVDFQKGEPVKGTSEDCLSLNVWTPALQPPAPLPVMVYIHGGGFTMGASSQELYDGYGLAQAGVVVVSMNYRLGALGFLGHPALSAETDTRSSGNYGLMDQRLALEWVRDNAARFGGDPTRVTLFGESAGAISACLQLLSPAAQGLFHRLIAQSGTCYLGSTPLHDPGTPGTEDSAEERGERLARDLGCTEGDVAACLRARGPEQVLGASGVALDLLQPHVSFAPVVDGAVIPQAPAELLSAGKVPELPVLIGSNKDEGTLFTMKAEIKTPEQYAQAVRTRSPAHAEALLKLYPASDYDSPKAAFSQMLGDAIFGCPTHQFAQVVSARGAPVHVYAFTYAPKRAFGSFFGRFLKLGSYHSAELPFVFGLQKGRYALDSDAERALSSTIIGYWTRFAAQGDPNGTGAPAWPAFTPKHEAVLGLDTHVAPGSPLNVERCAALRSLGL